MKRELGTKTAIGVNRFRMTPIIQSAVKTPVRDQVKIQDALLVPPKISKTPGLGMLSSAAATTSGAFNKDSSTRAGGMTTSSMNAVSRSRPNAAMKSTAVSPSQQQLLRVNRANNKDLCAASANSDLRMSNNQNTGGL